MAVASREQLKRLYFGGLLRAGVHRRLVRQRARRAEVVIVSLHHVSPKPNPFWPALSPELFEEFLIFLRRHFHVLSFKELREATPSSSARPLAVVSFDDGYQSFVDYAMPILDKYRLVVNQNVIPSCVASGLPPSDMRLYDLLAAAPLKRLSELRIPGFSFRMSSFDPREKELFGVAMSEFLRARSQTEREEVWAALEAMVERVGSIPSTPMMSAATVREAAQVHEIGANSFAHDSMALASDQVFQEDLDRCSEYFDRELHLPLHIYAFPYGEYRPSQIEAARQHGLQEMLLVGEGPSRIGGDVHQRFSLRGTSRGEVILRGIGHQPLRKVPPSAV